MTQELRDVTAVLAADMRSRRGMLAGGKAKATMGWSQYGREVFVDLPTVLKVVEQRVPAGRLKVEAREFLGAVDDAVPYVVMGTPGAVWDLGGISVFFPDAAGSYANNTCSRGSRYPTMQFAHDGWPAFPQPYSGGRGRRVRDPCCGRHASDRAPSGGTGARKERPGNGVPR